MYKKNTNEHKKEAWQAARKTTEYKNKAEQTKQEALTFLDDIKAISNELIKEKEAIKSISLSVNRLNQNINLKNASISEVLDQLNSRKSKIDEDLESFESAYEYLPVIERRVQAITELLDKAEESESKIFNLQKNIQSRRNSIEEVYREIFGYEDEDSEDETTSFTGLKEELDKTYEELVSNIDKLVTKVSDIEETSEKSFNKKIENWEGIYVSLKDQITKLLPNALTAGLSSAYSEKKKDELQDAKKYQNAFYGGIIGLLVISLIPFAVGVSLLVQGKDLVQVIYDLPRIVASILPLYIPAL